MYENEKREAVTLVLIGIVDYEALLLLVRVLMCRRYFHGWKPIGCQCQDEHLRELEKETQTTLKNTSNMLAFQVFSKVFLRYPGSFL